jgi:hypothetical protein
MTIILESLGGAETPSLPDPVEQVSLANLTIADVDGTGAMDVLMRAVKSHLDQEFRQGRVQGKEYATLYLGALQSTMATALQFVLQKGQANLDAQIKQQELLLAQQSVRKAREEVELVVLQQALALQQRLHLEDELLTSAKQRARLDQEIRNLQAQEDQIAVQTAQLEQQTLNLVSQKALVDAQADQVEQQTLNLASQKLQIEAETGFTAARTANAAKEGLVLDANKLKADSEKALLDQKKVTELAQVSPTGVDANSVIGKQKALYQAQADGFQRDAEQKVAKIFADTWNVRRTTDEATVADGTNKLNDTSIGAVMSKLATGIGVTV